MAWKIVCGIILIPLGFLPLRLLSFTSVLGILCCFGSESAKSSYPNPSTVGEILTNLSQVVLAVLVDGVVKPDKPGSLRDPATTYLFPKHWTTIPLSFGLLMCMYRPLSKPSCVARLTSCSTLGRPFRFPKHLPRHATPL